MKCLRSQSGITILEMTISTLGIAGLMLLFGQLLSTGMKRNKLTSDQVDATLDLTTLSSLILRMGRIAQSCEYISAPKVLNCRVDRHHPPTLDPTDDEILSIKYFPIEQRVDYGSNLSPNAIATFDGISAMDICDDAAITTLTCPIASSGISTRHIANLTAPEGPTGPNRLFRYRIKRELTSSSTLGTNPPPARILQSAFFVRHPNLDGLRFEWGTLD